MLLRKTATLAEGPGEGLTPGRVSAILDAEAHLDHHAALAGDYYEETGPAADLRELVACRWVRVFRQAAAPELSSVIPDGCADILVYDDAPPYVVGPDATTRWVRLRKVTVIIGLRLRPGAVRSIVGCPAAEILDGGALLSDLAPGAAALHERLLLTAGLDQRHVLLEDWVRASVDGRPPIDRAVVAACRLLVADPQHDLAALARRFGWNARAMHRAFRAACGYGPKHLQRIMRIQHAIRVVHGGPPASLTDVAHAAGYADQSHMTRDFRDITGFTPRQYLSTSRPEWGAWIGAGW